MSPSFVLESFQTWTSKLVCDLGCQHMVCYYWVGILMHGQVQEWMISIELESDIDSMKKTWVEGNFSLILFHIMSKLMQQSIQGSNNLSSWKGKEVEEENILWIWQPTCLCFVVQHWTKVHLYRLTWWLRLHLWHGALFFPTLFFINPLAHF
jgi:hypothetical protein